jgi:hypothetical protein
MAGEEVSLGARSVWPRSFSDEPHSYSRVQAFLPQVSEIGKLRQAPRGLGDTGGIREGLPAQSRSCYAWYWGKHSHSGPQFPWLINRPSNPGLLGTV